MSLPIVIITTLLSWIAYAPRFGQSIPADVGWLHLPIFVWPTTPSWLYRLTQGVHVGLGLILIPWILAKLWSVIPKFFHLPPLKSPAQALERISLLALVGGILFEIATDVLNIQYDYIFGFSFYTAHYWGAWVVIAGVRNMAAARVESFERFGAFKSVQFTAAQTLHPDSLLALKVNGVDLSLDHGFPARIMLAAIPGVHATKWVESLDFRES